MNSHVSDGVRTLWVEVTLAMFGSNQNHDGICKALGLHLPFFMSTTARFGMMLGAPVWIAGFLWKCMLAIIRGNPIRGAVLVRGYNWWFYFYCGELKNLGCGFINFNSVTNE